MSAFLADGDFVPRLSAHPLRADSLTDPSFGRQLAMSCHRATLSQDRIVLFFALSY
jgi:hypothetical protein